MASGLRTFSRLAASSMAKGSPSRRAAIWATDALFWFVTRKPGRMAAALSVNSATASDRRTSARSVMCSGSGTVRGGTWYSRSAEMWKGIRLVARMVNRGE
jgi:hypothetical protein